MTQHREQQHLVGDGVYIVLINYLNLLVTEFKTLVCELLLAFG